MKVLNLVTTPRPFFDNQIRILEQKGVEITTLRIPERETRDTRSITDYLRFYPNVLRRSIRGYDIVHANFGLTCPLALAQPKRPVVMTLWGTDLMGKYSRVSNQCAKFCDEVILPAESMASHLSTDYRLIPFGVDTELFRPIPKTTAREKLGWPTNKRIALFPYSPTRPVKNHGLAERVISNVDQDVMLKSVGNVQYERMPLYMNASDVVLITSKRESGPMTVKEAALCNVPVVSTDVGFVNDVLEDVCNSYVCQSEAELVEGVNAVIKDDAVSDGRKQLKYTCSVSAMGDEILSVYNRVMK